MVRHAHTIIFPHVQNLDVNKFFSGCPIVCAGKLHNFGKFYQLEAEVICRIGVSRWKREREIWPIDDSKSTIKSQSNHQQTIKAIYKRQTWSAHKTPLSSSLSISNGWIVQSLIEHTQTQTQIRQLKCIWDEPLISIISECLYRCVEYHLYFHNEIKSHLHSFNSKRKLDIER